MVPAYLHRKIKMGSVAYHDRSEDLLTSTAFGLLRHLPPHQWLVPLLDLTHFATLDQGAMSTTRSAGWFQFMPGFTLELQFWPWCSEFGQPDLLLLIRDTSARLVDVIVIEAKLDSGKSNWNTETEADSNADLPDPDQLVRYWQAAKKHTSNRHTVILLSSHATVPEQALAESLARRRDMRLGWLSWRDIWRTMKVQRPANRVEESITEDVLALLNHLGFSEFHGFSSTPLQMPADWHFWVEGGWFTAQSRPASFPKRGYWEGTRWMCPQSIPLVPSRQHFWRES